MAYLSKKGCFCYFWLFLGHLDTPQMTRKGTKRPASGQDMCPNMWALKKVPYRIIWPFLLEEMVQTNQKKVIWKLKKNWKTVKYWNKEQRTNKKIWLLQWKRIYKNLQKLAVNFLTDYWYSKKMWQKCMTKTPKKRPEIIRLLKKCNSFKSGAIFGCENNF